MNTTILVVEDDQDLGQYLTELLSDQRYIVQVVKEGSRAISTAETIHPDLVLLDLGLPDIDGRHVCQRLKEMDPTIPVIMLTARDESTDIVRGLELGADDYITKPFNGDELLARIKARLRAGADNNVTLKAADLEMNTQSMEVKRGEKLISLTRTEYQLLHYLMSNKNQVLTREMILSHVWAYSPDIESRVVDVYIGYLRQKIDKGHEKKLINSLRGFGYSIKE